MNILFALDSFKGCLTSADACAAAASGIRPTDTARCLPVSDGGEGLVDVLVAATGGHRIPCSAHDPLFRPLETSFGISGDGSTAFVEVAAASGLPLVPPARRNPLRTTSFGTGELLRAALAHGVRRVILGLGGSATNDAGLGLLQALGFGLRTASGTLLPDGATGADLASVAVIVPPADLPSFELVAPCDVSAPLYGPLGAAHVFAPQKGASPSDVVLLDDGLRSIAAAFSAFASGRGFSPDAPGCGAAGGIGAGLLACLGARLVPGIDLVFDAIGLDDALRGVDWVVTGEGRSDRQTLMGKLPSGIAARARRAGVRVALLAGSLADEDALRSVFDYVASINPPGLPLAEALRPATARANLARAVADWLGKQKNP